MVVYYVVVVSWFHSKAKHKSYLSFIWDTLASPDGLARSTVWWPGIDKDVDARVKNCPECQLHEKSPALAPLHPWEWPSRPWARIHIDHAGPFLGKLFLVVVDAFSKWLEVVIVPSTSSSATINVLRSIFATHGLPELLVSDNGTAFTSEEFHLFTKNNGIRLSFCLGTGVPRHCAGDGGGGMSDLYILRMR